MCLNPTSLLFVTSESKKGHCPYCKVSLYNAARHQIFCPLHSFLLEFATDSLPLESFMQELFIFPQCDKLLSILDLANERKKCNFNLLMQLYTMTKMNIKHKKKWLRLRQAPIITVCHDLTFNLLCQELMLSLMF